MAEKSIEEVYEDRNTLALAFAAVACELGQETQNTDWDAGWYMHDEWAVVFVETPAGQVSWHMRPEAIPTYFHDHEHDASVFDLHTREEKNDRLETLARVGFSPDWLFSDLEPEGNT